MECANCGNEIPDNAKMCQYCEAAVQPAPTEEELETAWEAFQQLDPDVRQALTEAMLTSKTCDEFVNRVLVGPCPKCGSALTDDCENDPEVGDPLLGRCFECGHRWCTGCDRPMSGGFCECWQEMEEEEQE